MAGYLFQLERALAHLALSPRGSRVGIETLDDVVALSPKGEQIREQDKHSTSDKQPLADRSKNLWNCLEIWLKAIDEEDLDLKTTEFHLVTNRKLTKGLAFDLKWIGKNAKDRVDFVEKLRAVGERPPQTTKVTVEAVLAHTNKQLENLVAKIRVADAASATHGKDLRKNIAGVLAMPPKHEKEIIQGLLGWLGETTLDLFRQRKPAWFSRDDFEEQYRRLLFRCRDVSFIRETAEALVPVDERDRDARRHSLFVKQLLWIGIPEDDDQILEAIDAHIRSGTEVTRLSRKGIVIPADFRTFDDNLVRRWKLMKRTHVPNLLPTTENELEDAGRAVLNHTMNHREMLAGQPTSEYYLTQGAYHRLADNTPRLGWHPQYEKKMKELETANEGTHAT